MQAGISGKCIFFLTSNVRMSVMYLVSLVWADKQAEITFTTPPKGCHHEIKSYFLFSNYRNNTNKYHRSGNYHDITENNKRSKVWFCVKLQECHPQG